MAEEGQQDNINIMTEKEKYEMIWSDINYRSPSAVPFANWCMNFIEVDDKVLDIGCGDGTTVELLRGNYIDAAGIDITLIGVEDKADSMPFYESPAWDLPFKDNSIDWIISTDVLEHIPPEKIKDTIVEMERVSKKGQIHNIACQPASLRYGMEVHLTVQALEWWQAQFNGVQGRCIITQAFKPFPKI